MSARRIEATLLAVILAASPATESCGGRKPSDAVARLAELHGAATKELAAKPEAWDGVAVGAAFSIGDAVRTDPGATAKIELVGGGRIQLGERTTVRFLPKGAAPGHVSVETGEAEVEPGASAMGIETQIGEAQIEPGSRVRLASTGRQLRFDVLVGGAELDARDGGAARVVKAGHRFVVDIGGAGIDVDALDAGADARPHADGGAPRDAGRDAATDLVTALVEGSGVRAAPSRRAKLEPLEEGSPPLEPGSRLVVPEGARVTISRGEERVTVLGGGDVDVGAAGAPLVRLAAGRLLVKSRRPGALVEVPGGKVGLVTAGAGDVQADLRLDRKAARVVSNHAELALHGTGPAATVRPGETGTLDARGGTTVDAVVARVADLGFAAGESSTVHARGGVAAVQLGLDGCPGDALVQVSSGGTVRRTFARADDPTSGIVRLGAGTHEYVASCVDHADVAERKGTIRVLADSGVERLARTAASNVVDADGRHYHVLYQSVLPQMTFRWPGAPSSGAVTFHALGARGEKKAAASGGTVALPAGALGEGTYRYWFDVDGQADRRSPDTTLVIGFDNAAPAAEIRSPKDGEPMTPTVHVSGIALEGSTVSVSGTPIPLDAEGRFSGDVPAPPVDHPVLVIRIAHPARGVHYFLRTLAPPSR